MLKTVQRMIPRRSGTESEVVECRHCGTTVDQDTDECPCCGSAEIARYCIR